jgi:anti-anti-sigma regulatory factor
VQHTSSQLKAFSRRKRFEGKRVLKIDFSETPTEERWILHGKLTDPWIHEFTAYWNKNHRRDRGRACLVDLNEVTFIDKCGEQLLRMLARAGAKFTVSGMYTKHILEQITGRLGTRRSTPKASDGKDS